MPPSQTTSQLIEGLPTRLRNFFAKFPPQHFSSLVTPRLPPPEGFEGQEESRDEPSIPSPEELRQNLPSPYTPSRDVRGYHKPDPWAWSPSKAILTAKEGYPNPFLPRKFFNGKRWVGPKYGLRKQADLVKMAKKYAVEPLLPPGKKSSEYKELRRAEKGLTIKGTGIGHKVKGHKWERTMETRLAERKKAMMEMPEMIRLWKQVSSSLGGLLLGGLLLTCMHTERAWSWLEALAQKVKRKKEKRKKKKNSQVASRRPGFSSALVDFRAILYNKSSTMHSFILLSGFRMAISFHLSCILLHSWHKYCTNAKTRKARQKSYIHEYFIRIE